MEVVAINLNNLTVGVTIVEKTTNETLKVVNIDDNKYVLENGKAYSLSTLKRNYKILVEEEVVHPEPIVENKPAKVEGRKKKLSDEQYIQIAEDFLKGLYKTKKEVALKYSVDIATISDIFTKYCRKSCFQQVQELKEKYNYKK